MIKKQKKTIKEEIRENINEDFYESKNGGLVWREDNKFFDACDLEDYIWDICRQILQRFIEETGVERTSIVRLPENNPENKIANRLNENMVFGYNQALQDINQRQQQWLRENL